MESELFDAIKDNDLDKVKTLIESDANINARNNEGETILWWSYGDFEFVEYLIEKGININIKNNEGETVLFSLCEDSYDEDKNFEVMILLIENGANINTRNSEGETVLQTCNWSDNLKQKLNEYDAKTLIKDACEKGYLKIAKLLIKNHFDVNADDDYNFELLSIVCEKGYFEILKLLIEKGADVNAKNDNYALKLLSIACEEGYFEIAKLLIEKGADVNAKDYHGYKALDYTYKIEIFNLLLDNGADISSHLLVTKDNNCMLKKYYMSKSKERSDLLREELIKKYYSPENIDKWSVYYNKPFDEVQEIM
jgi:ankyrin repeat protein